MPVPAIELLALVPDPQERWQGLSARDLLENANTNRLPEARVEWPATSYGGTFHVDPNCVGYRRRYARTHRDLWNYALSLTNLEEKVCRTCRKNLAAEPDMVRAQLIGRVEKACSHVRSASYHLDRYGDKTQEALKMLSSARELITLAKTDAETLHVSSLTTLVEELNQHVEELMVRARSAGSERIIKSRQGAVALALWSVHTNISGNKALPYGTPTSQVFAERRSYTHVPNGYLLRLYQEVCSYLLGGEATLDGIANEVDSLVKGYLSNGPELFAQIPSETHLVQSDYASVGDWMQAEWSREFSEKAHAASGYWISMVEQVLAIPLPPVTLTLSNWSDESAWARWVAKLILPFEPVWNTRRTRCDAVVPLLVAQAAMKTLPEMPKATKMRVTAWKGFEDIHAVALDMADKDPDGPLANWATCYQVASDAVGFNLAEAVEALAGEFLFWPHIPQVPDEVAVLPVGQAALF